MCRGHGLEYDDVEMKTTVCFKHMYNVLFLNEYSYNLDCVIVCFAAHNWAKFPSVTFPEADTYFSYPELSWSFCWTCLVWLISSKVRFVTTHAIGACLNRLFIWPFSIFHISKTKYIVADFILFLYMSGFNMFYLAKGKQLLGYINWSHVCVYQVIF